MKKRREGRSKKETHPIWGEESPAEIRAHEELVHEDRDPIYPFEPPEAIHKKKAHKDLKGKKK